MGWEHQELLTTAIAEALAPHEGLETEYDSEKLNQKVKSYFTKAAKNLEFGSKWWNELVEDYADNVYGVLFVALGDREWLPQADFLLCLDAGIKYGFPGKTLKKVSPEEFEQAVLAANDRAWDEQRFLPQLWTVVEQHIEATGKQQKKVYNAFADSRGNAVKAGKEAAADNVQVFLSTWVLHTYKALEKPTNGDVPSMLPMESAVALFTALLDVGGVPQSMTDTYGPTPPGWLDMVIGQAYTEDVEVDMAVAPKAEAPKAKKQKWAADAGAGAWGAPVDPWGGAKGFGKGAFGGGMGAWGPAMTVKGMGKAAWGPW